jgi:hypothetical protein
MLGTQEDRCPTTERDGGFWVGFADLAGASSDGKFLVSRAEEAYDANARVQIRNSGVTASRES